jgi:hypothetical protein
MPVTPYIGMPALRMKRLYDGREFLYRLVSELAK